MIIIAGDSWACGEWHNGSIAHKGVSEYLTNIGINNVNIGVGGSSNYDTIIRLDTILRFFTNENKLLPESSVIIFQTEWFRDLNLRYHSSMKIKTNEPLSDSLISQMISYWQYRLSEMAKHYNVKIYLVGGASDTIWLDKFEEEYPGLKILCQSLTNYCINNNSRVENPVFGIQYTDSIVNMYKELASTSADLEFLIKEIDRGIERQKLWHNSPEYFWPDGNHANRDGHYKLFQLIKEKVLGN